MHDKHEHVDGWFNPEDGSAVSQREVIWEKSIPFILLGLAGFTLLLDLIVWSFF